MANNSLPALGVLFVTLALFGCRTETPPPASGNAQHNVQINVSVAASTSEVMESLATTFGKEKGLSIKVNPGPSSGLASQIVEGAPVDLFLSANREFATNVKAAGLSFESHELLTNRLVLIAPQGNPAKLQKPEDLLTEKVKKIALAGENVPAGKYADQALKRLELFERLQTAGKIARAQDVRSALHFVEQGEAEAGIVYSTDARDADVVTVHEFDPSLHDEIFYVLVLTKRGARNPDARDFFEFVQSSEAGAVFSKAGFQRVGEKKE
jgi:molybdate transport system substrate-binding protein